MRRRVLAAGAVLTVLNVAVAVPARAAADPGWTHPGYGSGRTFYNPHETVINGGSISGVRLRWATELPTIEEDSCTGPSAPLVAGGRVFVTDETGIGAYRLTTGAPLWHYDFDLPDNERTPHLAVSGKLLIAGNTECQSQSDPHGGIVALDVATGRKKWSAGGNGPVASLVVDKGIVAVAGWSESSPAAVRGYRVSDGKLRWTVRDYWSAGVSAGGRLLVEGTRDQGIAALAIATGKRLWSKPYLYTAVAANPDGSTFLVADDDGGLVCLKSANGAKVWGANGTGGAVATDGKRVYRGFSNSMQALDDRTGKLQWSHRFGSGAYQPVRAGGLLYTEVEGQGLRILSAATGVPAIGSPFGATPDDTVVVAGGRLLMVRGDTIEAYAP
ncbi:PQQ-binding-like beta-propeller repeat protein [Pseudosporangium ferrugineum]|uniref:PQQ-binding-like beta-propeller repeat protein n=1 Tax=Pseudosporangium ferrugineum TaxID=439699 RepID=UPI001304E94D|nr:PQQ-binding-like beta-propeller repeat protein [Pseudosporangium ferrugineum]